MYNPFFTFLNGKTATIEGQRGTFKHESYEARYPYKHTVEKLIFDIEDKGGEYYRAIKEQLGDDWNMDVTDNIEVYVDTAIDLGFSFRV